MPTNCEICGEPVEFFIVHPYCREQLEHAERAKPRKCSVCRQRIYERGSTVHPQCALEGGLRVELREAKATKKPPKPRDPASWYKRCVSCGKEGIGCAAKRCPQCNFQFPKQPKLKRQKRNKRAA